MATIGLISIAVLTVLGLPVWLSILTGSTIALVDWGFSPAMIVDTMFSRLSSFLLVAVPLFIFSGQLLAYSGIARPLITFANRILGRVPGGPAYAMIITCVIFAAMSSSSLAALAGLAPVALPMMKEAGYSRRFSAGLLMAGSALGPLIPPSIYLIIFGQLTDQSVQQLWVAAFLPGFMVAFLLAVTVFIHSRRGHYEQPSPSTWAERGEAFRHVWPILLLPIAVLVPMYVGWCTPTESGVIAVVFTLLLGFLVYKGLTWRRVFQAASDTAHLTSMIFLIIAAAFVLNTAFTYARIPFTLAEWFSGAGFNAALLPLALIPLFTLMGMFLDPNSILVVLGPMLMPLILALDMEPVAYSVFVCLMVELAVLTPPFGLVLFAATGILKEDFAFVSRSVALFYPALILGAILILYFPQISTFLGKFL
jgi:C4-dicarboxylate transporter DctM subunit